MTELKANSELDDHKTFETTSFLTKDPQSVPNDTEAGNGKKAPAPNTSDDDEGPDRSCWVRYRGICFALCCCVFFSLANLLAKVLNDYHAFSISIWRYLGILGPSLPILLYFRIKGESVTDTCIPLSDPNKRRNMIFLIGRGLFGGASIILRFCALMYLTIGDATVIAYSTPVFVTILAHFFLNEKAGIVTVLIAIVTFGGVVIITRPPFLTGGEGFDTETLIGSVLAFASMVCFAIMFVLQRKIRSIHWAFMTFVFGLIGFVQAMCLAFGKGVYKTPATLNDILLTLALATLTLGGQIAIIFALKFEQAGTVSLVRTCDVIFAFFWQMVFLSVFPDVFSGIGAFIVVGCVLLTSFRKYLKDLPEDNPTRKRWGLLLK